MTRNVNHFIESNSLARAAATGSRADTICGLSIKKPRLGKELATCKRCVVVRDFMEAELAAAWDAGWAFSLTGQDPAMNPYRS